MLALLNFKLIGALKLFLYHNSLNLNNLCREIEPNASIKREAVILKINQLYNAIEKIPSVQSDKQKQIMGLIDVGLDSLREIDYHEDSEQDVYRVEGYNDN